MPKEEITSLDLRFLARELRKILLGGSIQKIYEYGTSENYQFLFEIYKKTESADSKETNHWLYFDKKKIYLTDYKKTVPQTPPSFCMFLRKYLMSKRVVDITQYKFDRILEIKTRENILIIELFSDGNVILTDNSYNIIMPLIIQKWKDREIKPKIRYQYPPGNMNPFSTDLDTFRKTLSKEDRVLEAALAANFGFGKEYAQELCLMVKIDGKKLSKDLNVEQVVGLYGMIEGLDKKPVSPTVYTDSAYIFPLQSTPNRKPVKENLQTISKAFDEHFSQKDMALAAQQIKKSEERKEKKIEHVIQQQKHAEQNLTKQASESRSVADLIYANYTLINSVLSGIKKALKSGKKWPEIKQLVEKEDTPESHSVKEIREHEGIILLSVSGMDIEIDINKTIEQNAEDYYNESKKSKRKLEGVKTALEHKLELEKKLAAQKTEDTEVVPGLRKERKKWYEKFKWFMSSAGMLVIAGRDATQNENIVKKHAEQNDFLFHADIAGAAFVLVKSDGKPIDEVTMKEAAEFSASNSKAWTRGIGNVDVYAFRPEQATKPEGSLGKGSFVIGGQRIWFRDMPLKLSIGIKIEREKNIAKTISGPVMAVRKHSNYFVTVHPGANDSLGLAREIKNKIMLKSRPEDRYFIDRIPIGDIQIHIPSGRGDIVE